MHFAIHWFAYAPWTDLIQTEVDVAHLTVGRGGIAGSRIG
jgi:hypothetical protein